MQTRRLLAVSAGAVTLAGVIAAGPSSAATTPPSLTGETFVALDNLGLGAAGQDFCVGLSGQFPAVCTFVAEHAPGELVGNGGTVDVTAHCNADGSGSGTFSVTGVAAGPYPGTFTETGTLSIGPQEPGTPYSQVTGFTADFTITSAVGTVTGHKFFDPAVTFRRTFPCTATDFEAPVPFLKYEATITTAAGTFHDEGDTAARIAVFGDNRDGGYFVEAFGSTLVAPIALANPPSTADECKNGGWLTRTDAAGRPFKNQGDCVSYVSTNGRNGAAG